MALHTCSGLQGVLIARVTGRPLPDVLAERLFEPLGMADTGFTVPAAKRDRFTDYYRASRKNGLELADAPDAVRQMTSDQLSAAQREAGRPFLDGQGWGFGGSVDIERTAAGNVPGRYGWVGGTGTSAHLTPATGTVTIALTQCELTSAAPPDLMRDVWRYAAGR